MNTQEKIIIADTGIRFCGLAIVAIMLLFLLTAAEKVIAWKVQQQAKDVAK